MAYLNKLTFQSIYSEDSEGHLLLFFLRQVKDQKKPAWTLIWMERGMLSQIV